jgi:hypothetical protein
LFPSVCSHWQATGNPYKKSQIPNPKTQTIIKFQTTTLKQKFKIENLLGISLPPTLAPPGATTWAGTPPFVPINDIVTTAGQAGLPLRPCASAPTAWLAHRRASASLNYIKHNPNVKEILTFLQKYVPVGVSPCY